MRTLSIAAVAGLTLLFTACGRDGHADPKPGAPSEAATPAGVAEAAVPAAKPVSDKQYSVQVAPVSLQKGASGTATVTIQPAKGLKFNEEFPAKFSVRATPYAKGGKDKLTLKAGDVKIVDKQGVVTVPLEGVEAGAGAVQIVGNFSVCNDEQCFILRDQALDIPVTVR